MPESLEGKQFDQRKVEYLFKEVLEDVSNISDERFQITLDYKVDLVSFIETQVVMGFTEMHKSYCNHSSPQAL